jgi:hypothetical protein
LWRKEEERKKERKKENKYLAKKSRSLSKTTLSFAERNSFPSDVRRRFVGASPAVNNFSV